MTAAIGWLLAAGLLAALLVCVDRTHAPKVPRAIVIPDDD